MSGDIAVEIAGGRFEHKMIRPADFIIPDKVQRIAVCLILNIELVETAGIPVHYFNIAANPVFIIALDTDGNSIFFIWIILVSYLRGFLWWTVGESR